jgi:hypothetical protein
VALLVKRDGDAAIGQVRYRDLWGIAKRAALLDDIDAVESGKAYSVVEPSTNNRFALRRSNIAADYASWPRLPQLAAQEPISGLQEMRQGALMDGNRDELERRMRRYFDASVSMSVLEEENCGPVHNMAEFDADRARASLLLAETFRKENLRRYYERPFESRWCYFTSTRPLWNRARPEFRSAHKP